MDDAAAAALFPLDARDGAVARRLSELEFEGAAAVDLTNTALAVAVLDAPVADVDRAARLALSGFLLLSSFSRDAEPELPTPGIGAPRATLLPNARAAVLDDDAALELTSARVELLGEGELEGVRARDAPVATGCCGASGGEEEGVAEEGVVEVEGGVGVESDAGEGGVGGLQGGRLCAQLPPASRS